MYWGMDSLAWVGLTLVLGVVMAVRFVQQRIRRRTEHERARIRDRLRSKDCWVSVGMLSGGVCTRHRAATDGGGGAAMEGRLHALSLLPGRYLRDLCRVQSIS